MFSKTKFIKYIFSALVLVLTISFSLPVTTLANASDELDQNRARLLTYVIRRQVENHFSGKQIDDELSKAAFHLYVKQLDYQKRLFLAEEIEQLRIFSDRIDDEVKSGRIVLAPLAFRLLRNNIARAEKLVDQALSTPFNFSIKESYESDPENLDFCDNEKELGERWRKELKYRTLLRYLNLLDDEGVKDPLGLSKDRQKKAQNEAREKVRKQFVQYFERLKKETLKDHYDRYLNSFSRAFDPHTTYMAPQSKEDFDISMRGSLEGIGATLREEDGYIKVVKIIPGSAASRQGQLHADDVILAVGQGKDEPVDVTDMRLRDAVALIRGKKGTEVRLTVRRQGLKPFVIPIVRDVVIIEESFVKSAVVEDPKSEKSFGYIKIPSFYRDFELTRNGGKGRNSTEDVKAAIKTFKKKNIVGLVLDLRNNGGGALTDAVGIAGLFLGEGPVVQVRKGDGDAKVLRNYENKVAYDGPMVVLINRFSASASEIVAGALQDYGRALVVGSEHTHGKGTVQVILDLDKSLTLRNMRQYMPLGALKMTTQKFYRVNGDSTQYRGIEPDIILPDRSKYNEYGERYLDYSLPWDRIKPVEHKKWPVPNVAELFLNSQSRVTANEDFTEIDRISEAMGERISHTRQSLNINQVIKERKDLQGMTSVTHEIIQGDADLLEVEKGGQESVETEEDASLSKRERLLKKINKDPYVTESIAILKDIVSQPAEASK